MGLGGYPDVTLAGAREARAKAKAGVDPIEDAKAARSALAASRLAAKTFRQCATAYVGAHKAGWKNAKHAKQWSSTLETYAYRSMGDMLVRDVGLPQVLAVLEPIWTNRTETATRLRGRIESGAAVTLLRHLPVIEDNDLVFPAPRGGELSDMTLTAVTRRMKVDAVPHGFRSSFRDWCAERTNYPRDVAEMALAHAIGDKVEAAYRRGDLFDKRRRLMAEWVTFCRKVETKGEVVSIGKNRAAR